jgi:hypothetical protein
MRAKAHKKFKNTADAGVLHSIHQLSPAFSGSPRLLFTAATTLRFTFLTFVRPFPKRSSLIGSATAAHKGHEGTNSELSALLPHFGCGWGQGRGWEGRHTPPPLSGSGAAAAAAYSAHRRVPRWWHWRKRRSRGKSTCFLLRWMRQDHCEQTADLVTGMLQLPTAVIPAAHVTGE